MNNPVCPRCGHHFAWVAALKNIIGRSRQGTALWGLVCPACQADLKVPNSRVLLIVTSAIFFGSQSSTLFLLRETTLLKLLLLNLFLVLGFYAIAVFFFLKLEPVE